MKITSGQSRIAADRSKFMGIRSNLSVVGFVVIVTCAVNCDTDALFSDQVTPIPASDESRRSAEKDPKAEDLMAAKLDHAEQILAGLVTHDFEKIARSAETDDKEVYEHFRMEFMRQAARLEREANNRNLAGAAYFQQSLTATCIACHDYMRDEDLQSK
jgi:hypothetical protein